MRRSAALALAIAAFLLFGTTGGAVVCQGERLRAADRRAAAAHVAARAAFAIEQQLSRSLAATYALAAVVRQGGTAADFDALAAEMLPMYEGLSSLQLAPGGVVQHIHPLAGNEAAIGHDLLRDPARRFQARAALESRTLTLAGPFELKQGGTGLAGRLAVFVPDPAARGGERFWGFVSAVIGLPDLLDAARMAWVGEAGYAWALARQDPETGEPRAIAGEATVGDDPVVFAVSVPNGRWTLAVTPAGGWAVTTGLWFQYGLALLSALGLSALVFLAARRPAVLRRVVAERTAELARTNALLAEDVAERRRAEAALAVTQAVVDRAVYAIAWADEDGTLAYANEAFAALCGAPPGALAGKPVSTALPALPEDRWREALQALDAGAAAVHELRIGYGRAARHLRLSLDRVRLHPRPLVVLFAWDVTEQRAAEEQLRQAQRMDAIGQLAGGVAHDFNNLLTGILGHASVLLETLPGGSEEHEAAATIRGAGLRAAELTRQLLGFARRADVDARPVDAHAVAQEVAKLLARTVDKRIRIVERLRAPTGVVVGDAGQLQQALLNLAVNARDAMPEGGELALESALVELDARRCERHPGTSPGPHLALTVADTGTGIPPDLAGRIFEPFFTTKEPGRGTGMGLAIVYGITRDHRGAVEVASAPGEGSRFTLLLPLAGAAIPAAGRARIVVS